ncbi:MAG: HD domain-containing protein, partial [Brevefilum sp.]
GWTDFQTILVKEISPIYQQHEASFDFSGIHGRMHIFRAVIFAEWISRFYIFDQNVPVDIFAVRMAVAFHDAGRQGNGPDFWEKDSSQLCHDYLVQQRYDQSYADFVAKLILKHGEYGIEKRIVHDADVLEIMRPCCGHGGFNGFKIKKFRFGRQGDPYFHQPETAKLLRERLVSEAWNFILETEAKKQTFRESSAYFEDLMKMLYEQSDEYPILSSVCR